MSGKVAKPKDERDDSKGKSRTSQHGDLSHLDQT